MSIIQFVLFSYSRIPDFPLQREDDFMPRYGGVLKLKMRLSAYNEVVAIGPSSVEPQIVAFVSSIVHLLICVYGIVA